MHRLVPSRTGCNPKWYTSRIKGREYTCNTHIGNHRQDGHRVEDFLPRSDVSGLGCHRPSELGGELPGVNADLHDVVEQSKKRSQGEGGHEQSDETKLNH